MTEPRGTTHNIMMYNCKKRKYIVVKGNGPAALPRVLMPYVRGFISGLSILFH